jgi:type II secretion system protein L
LTDEELASQVQNSWLAMGFQSSVPVVGRVSVSLGAMLADGSSDWQVEPIGQLQIRTHANLAIEADGSQRLNFRHGKWSVKRSWQGFSVWRRPLAMAVGLMLIWCVVTVGRIYSLEQQADGLQSAIEVAFHRGLPNETVMLDPLAQLRKAAGSSVSAQQGGLFLDQLQHVSNLYRNISWEMSELDFHDGEMRMSGTASDIESLNTMRDQLQKSSGRNVVISDTDLTGDRVSFRMTW